MSRGDRPEDLDGSWFNWGPAVGPIITSGPVLGMLLLGVTAVTLVGIGAVLVGSGGAVLGVLLIVVSVFPIWGCVRLNRSLR